MPATMPGADSGSVTPKNVASASGAEVLAGLAHAQVDAVERDEQRQDHEAEVVVDDRQLHGRLRLEDVDRAVDDAQVLQPLRTSSPFGASGMRHAIVRMRKLVKLGTTTSASRMARHFSLTLKARKYATGNPISRHSTVAIDRDADRGLERREEHAVGVEHVAVVLQRQARQVDRECAASSPSCRTSTRR